MTSTIKRRALLLAGAGVLTGALPARLALAGDSRDAEAPRLVLVMLRGALDGLAAAPAIGDPAWAALRGEPPAGALPLGQDGLFALHPALARLHGWYGEGQLLLLHAMASPYRERSHFDAQQQLESGGEKPFALATGWLGRALQASGQTQGAVALTPAMPVALRGASTASTWTPTRQASSSSSNDDQEDLLLRVSQLYGQDAALASAWRQAMAQQGMAAGTLAAAAAGNGGTGLFTTLAAQAGQFLAAERGPRVAWLESGGWDTHTQQGPRLQRLLSGLDEGLHALRQALGPHWARSAVLVMTEFGRSALPNGSGGTDHGTGGLALLAGGAVAGGRVLSDWPGLSRAALLDGRDLRPTQDIRALLAALLQRQFGVGQARLQGELLPGAPKALDGLWRA